MGSNTFLALITQGMTVPSLDALFKALSVLQFPPLVDSLPASPRGLLMCPVVQATWARELQTYFFVRLHPRLRSKEAAMDLDGGVIPGERYKPTGV